MNVGVPERREARIKEAGWRLVVGYDNEESGERV